MLADQREPLEKSDPTTRGRERVAMAIEQAGKSFG